MAVTTGPVRFIQSKEFFNDFQVFNIPIYQREYRWSTKQVIEFIEDVISDLSDSKQNDVSFGVIYGFAKGSTKVKINIVDGQQRLTTFLIMLKVITEITGRDELKEWFLEKNINRLTADNESLNNKYIKLFVENDLESDELSGTNLLNTYNVLKDILNKDEIKYKNFFSDPEKKSGIKKFSVNKLESGIINEFNFLLYTYKSEDEANKSFLRLNGRGTPLSFVDLLKSLFFNSTKSGKDIANKINDLTSNEDNYNRQTKEETRYKMVESAFAAYAKTIEGIKTTNKEKLYKVFSKYKENQKDFISKVLPYVEEYISIAKSDHKLNNIYKLMTKSQADGIKTTEYVPLLAYVSNKSKNKAEAKAISNELLKTSSLMMLQFRATNYTGKHQKVSGKFDSSTLNFDEVSKKCLNINKLKKITSKMYEDVNRAVLFKKLINWSVKDFEHTSLKKALDEAKKN